jgi:hypothetical protein
MRFDSVAEETAMDHERYPDFTEPKTRRARAERAARVRQAASVMIADGWNATRRAFAAVFYVAKQRP